MIKVRAGQVWEFKGDAGNYMLGDRLRISDKDVELDFFDALPINIDNPSYIYRVSDGFLNRQFKFIPQNDLEWLAVNLDDWYCAADYLRNASGSPFICGGDHPKAVSRWQWQNMRYHLGLDTKPHYKMINGEWVK